MTKTYQISFRILFILYIAAVLYLCFGHFENATTMQEKFLGIAIDKVLHFAMFFPFPILAFLAFDKYTESVKSSLLFVGGTFLVGMLLALGSEWGQAYFTTYRQGDPKDVLADGLGLLLSCVIVLIWDIRKQKR